MEFVKSSGGRENYFKRPNVKDCVTRAVCNATGNDYMEVYNGIKEIQVKYNKQMGRASSKHNSPRNGVPHNVTKNYIEKVLKWKWHELPAGQTILEWNIKKGTYLIQMKHHLTCIKDNKLYDSWDCQTKKKDKSISGYWAET